MTDGSRLTFGEMTVFGELARGVHPADEMGLAMALALGQPDNPAPAFATVPVLLDSCPIGQLKRIEYVWGGINYEFESGSGQTRISSETKEAVLRRLREVLGLAGPPESHHGNRRP